MIYSIGTLVFLFTLLYLRSNSDNKDSQISSANWIKTTILGLLTIVFGTFYYKTNQVVTVPYHFWVDGYNVAYSKDGIIVDTIDCITIHNYFESSFFNNYYKKTKENHVTCSYTLAIPNSYDWNLYAYRGEDSLKSKANLLNKYPSELGRVYEFEVYLTSPPSFIPIKVTQTYKSEPMKHGEQTKRLIHERNLYDSAGLYNPFKDLGFAKSKISAEYASTGISAPNEITDSMLTNLQEIYEKNFIANGLQKVYSRLSSIVASDKNKLNLPIRDDVSFENCLFNFFTAADISQYVIAIGFNSDIAINELRFFYDIPIEVSSDYNDIDRGTYGFGLNQRRIKDILQNGGEQKFYVKLPSMANLQLVRSFILTSLLVSLATLFFVSLMQLIFVCKIKFMSFLSEKLERTYVRPNINKDELIFKLYRFVIFAFLSLSIIFLCYRTWIDEPFVFDEATYERYKSYFSKCSILLLAIFVYLYIRFLYTKGRLYEKNHNLKKSSKIIVILRQFCSME